jgi:hypothetical protein
MAEAGCANLSPDDRRKLAVQFVARWLNWQQIPLSTSEVNLLAAARPRPYRKSIG